MVAAGMNRSTRSVSLCRVLPAMNSITMKSAPFDLVDFVDGDDVGVVPRGGGFGFLNEALLAGLVFHFLRMEHLDADEPVEPQIARFIDDAHTAFADPFENLVARDVLAGRHRSSDLRERRC